MTRLVADTDEEPEKDYICGHRAVMATSASADADHCYLRVSEVDSALYVENIPNS